MNRIHRVPFEGFLPVAYVIGLIGLAQYLGITSWLMTEYPGGNLYNSNSEGYDFLRNFLSDLGRTTAFGRANPNAIYYALTLGIAGLSTIVFFGALGHFLFYSTRNFWAIPTTLFAFVAGIGYVGIAMHPIDVNYSAHISFVQIGFIGFWCMAGCCAMAIFRSAIFPNGYAKLLIGFIGLLGIQIAIMLLGPRSWSSEPALLLQVVAQKIVVYAELAGMLVVNIGAFMAFRRYRHAITNF